MKKNAFFGLLLLIALFFNCSSDETNSASIIGKWNFKSTVINGNVLAFKHNSTCNKDFIQFLSNSNGKLAIFSGTTDSDCVENANLFSFNRNNNEIEFNIDIESENEFKIEKLDVSSLHLKTDSGKIYIFERVYNLKN